VPAHPLWNPFETPSQEDIDAARAALAVWVPALVEVVAPDPAWPRWYAAARDGVLGALGDRVLAIEHVGSTSVPGLGAKPTIDVDLTVADSAAEDAWLPDLEAAGSALRVREPDWEEHRLLRGWSRPPTCTSSHQARVSPAGTSCSATGYAATPTVANGTPS
jgi:GrpB-like predicted nucleotidyltransferase (UPF0157 family)